MHRLSSKLHLLWQRGKPLCSNLCCSLQTGSELAHVHPQRTAPSQCQGLGGNQCYKVLMSSEGARANVNELQCWITKIR